jgi:tetratricopeptide (TPR) repeat protein
VKGNNGCPACWPGLSPLEKEGIMKRFTIGLTLGITLTLFAAESLRAQSYENEQLREPTDITVITVLPSASMADFLRSEAAKRHCCTTDKFLEGAEFYKRAAEHGFDGNPDSLEAAVSDLRLAGYFFYYAGEFDRAFSAVARVGVIERDRGNKREAAQALLEAAHIARWSGDTQRARGILMEAYKLDPDLEPESE